MASLTLQSDGRALKEYPVGPMVTIGRLPDNTVVIDHAAVSSHHACIFQNGDHFIVEDLQSTNGTFVNDVRIVRQTLQHGDTVLVGRHKLLFDELGTSEATVGESELATSNREETVFLDAQKHQRLLAVVTNAEARAQATEGAAATPAKLGVLRVQAGRADKSEYLLEGHTSLIGRASWTLVRLKGWFKPSVAVAITRHQHGYVANLLRGKMQINREPMNGRCDLKEGDVLEVGGLTLVFGFKELGSLAAAVIAFVLVASATIFAGCEKKADAVTPEQIERQYGVSGAYTDDVTTSDGTIHGTLIPVTLADGRKAHLLVPQQRRNDPHGVYVRDDNGLHPVRVKERATREEISSAPTVVETRSEPAHAQKRSWEKDALIIGGSAGAGTAIGAVAGGKKGAAIGAVGGGIGGLIYDLATKHKE